MKCRASVISTIAISWVSSMERRIREERRPQKPLLLVTRTPTLPAVAMSSFRSISTIWTRGMRFSTEAQERIIGRTKLSDIELDDTVKPTSAHSALTTIVEDGKEIKILRDNMPFGRPSLGEFGTYFIGYSRSPRTIEQMLENMFIGRPPGNYDRLLDFSRAATGNLFFVPSATFLENLADDQTNEDQSKAAESPAETSLEPTSSIASSSNPSVRDGSLGIGSLKGDIRHE